MDVTSVVFVSKSQRYSRSLSTVVKLNVCTPAGLTHRASRRPSQQMRGQTAESLRCAAVCLSRSPLTATQPSLHCTAAELTDSSLREPKTFKTSQLLPNWCSKTLPLIILKPHNYYYYYYYLTSSALALTGSRRNFPTAQTKTRCSSWQLQFMEGGTFSCSHLRAIWP